MSQPLPPELLVQGQTFTAALVGITLLYKFSKIEYQAIDG